MSNCFLLFSMFCIHSIKAVILYSLPNSSTGPIVYAWISDNPPPLFVVVIMLDHYKLSNYSNPYLAGRSSGWLWPGGGGLLRRGGGCQAGRRSPAGATELCNAPSTCSPHPGWTQLQKHRGKAREFSWFSSTSNCINTPEGYSENICPWPVVADQQQLTYDKNRVNKV